MTLIVRCDRCGIEIRSRNASRSKVTIRREGSIVVGQTFEAEYDFCVKCTDDIVKEITRTV